MTAVAAPTIAITFKERIMNMPDDLNTKKDVDEYFKQLMKDIKEEMKKEKIENAEKKKNDKKKKRDNLDEDGNEKPKETLNKYQQFIRDNQERIKEEFPELSNAERFTKLAEEWGKFKATLEDPTEPVEPVKTVVEEEEQEKEEEDEKPKKAAKKPKKKAVE
jgi:thiamine pyrophosphate-dependent acetolactate synthase large subunit-like protein